ncbi:type II toxin-antitoxin system RelB/DinJ family antitoxin [Streptococcus macacae]|uniref:Addiction module antitoxin, RelB/DinJ family n=1 Tax=Streptococcus macacae NCTC 11558 TaxID=764298 RepID=G5JUM9_9STRE|nr:type II toxin-antitoxin system RelB/DinJ family antitoxin [Streptococcus macacae]EHJ51782.1 addiction module antitoxin, RelB/DinJ family [Streptococcus macacae NCTC 11558]SUN78846.1 addiction module antitoxin [Streptococcus macacae NCTC 11558]
MTTISVRVDDHLKKEAQELYRDLGLDMSTAITMFLKKSIQTQGIPFSVSRYSPETMQAFYEAEHGLTKSFPSLDALFEDLNDED